MMSNDNKSGLPTGDCFRISKAIKAYNVLGGHGCVGGGGATTVLPGGPLGSIISSVKWYICRFLVPVTVHCGIIFRGLNGSLIAFHAVLSLSLLSANFTILFFVFSTAEGVILLLKGFLSLLNFHFAQIPFLNTFFLVVAITDNLEVK